MDFYTTSVGPQHVIGYGSQSVVLAHHHHHPPSHHHHHEQYYRTSAPQRSIVKPVTTTTTKTYQLIPLEPVTVLASYTPVRQHSSPVVHDPFHAEQYQPSRGTSAKIPRYNALDDPHMHDFYVRKFGKRARSAPRRRTRPDALYRITVKTMDVKDAGTNAKVYLSIYGSRDKICRKLLTRETMLRGQNQLSLSLNGLNKVLDNDIYNMEFKRGATDIVYIRCRDLGIIHHVTLEHSGLLFEQSWFCEFILITNVRSGRSWLFPCKKWLSLFEPGDGSLSVDLYPNNQGLEYDGWKPNDPKDTNYEIIVITGDHRGAGTDSQVHVTLFGASGKKTEKLHLQKSINHKDPFERNQTDTFRVRGDFVGELVKLRIEHDNTGRMPGWFLDRVVVTDLYDPKVKYYASCNKWLAKNEGDGQISRDLHLRKEIDGQKPMNKYKITICTGKRTGAGTDADVFITLYGTSGDSGSIVLNAKKDQFESGSKDEFVIECPALGELKKILIGHNNKGRAPGWFLDRVFIEDLEENRTYEFPCDKWLATDEDDGQISRYLFAKKSTGGDRGPTAGIPYHITVYTGDVRNAGTDAQVYIVLHSRKISSEKTFLTNGKFERKSVDTFTIDGPEGLSPLSALNIGHDNTGVAAGWFLDKVVVDCPSTGITQTFPCNAWLADDEGDRRIERRLKEDESLRIVRAPTVPWYIWVYTSDKKGAGTDARVVLVLYGHDGKSDDIHLKSKSDVFEAGKCDEFKVDVVEVGTPFKLRVRHDNSRAFASWHLDRIEMENLTTNKRYVFPCGRWLSKKEDDKQIVRELPAQGPGIKKPLPVVKYFVDVYTGKKANAGTDANVFINIFGECGDTGERPLEHSKNANKFERNQMDSFVVEAVSLKQLRKIIIGHDGSGPGAGWFLDKVVVRPEDQRYEPATFECNRWLAVDEDDGQLVRELKPNNAAQHLDKTSYHVKIRTGDVYQAGTDADVHLQIFGDKAQTDKITLRSSENTSNKFERGQIDSFPLEFEDLGRIERIKIGHNGKNLGDGWFLDWVEIDVPMRGLSYRFACHRWLDKKEGDGKTELDLGPPEVIEKRIVIPYEITVFTGDKVGAGTDATVFVQMYGLNGKTEEIVLKNKSDSFERKQKDTFKIEAPDIGQIQKIRIGHRNEGLNAAWYLEKVLVQRHLSEDFGKKKKKGLKSQSSLRLSQISAKDPNVEEYWFVCRQWFDASKGDRHVVRDLLPTDEDGNVLSDRHEVAYEVHVFTGNKRGAGTDANVFITIYGELEDSGDRELTKSQNRNKFEQNQEDIFIVKAIDLGRLRKIKIRHDNSGIGAAWYLDRVEIVDPQTSKTYTFLCQKWLAENEDDGLISRELPAIDDKALGLLRARLSNSNTPTDFGLERKALFTTYIINVITAEQLGSGTNANVYIIIYGEEDDTGKIPLTRSKTHKDPFEHGHTDVFEIEASDIGEPKKIRIGHDNAGFRPDWLLERVELDVPKMGRVWVFPCGKWLSKSKGDHQLELELYPKDTAMGVYNPRVPYEIKVFTSKVSGAGTDANVHIQIYGREASTQEIMLCSKTDRKGKFQTGSVDTFVRELDDVGDTIEKIRIGHDNTGFGAAWHLDRVEIRRLLKGQKTKTYIFPCNRWFAKNEDDRAIVRDLIPEKVIEERVDRSGHLQVREREIDDHLEMKKYQVDVYTGDKFMCGTNANVFVTIFGDKGDTGERELSRSETHMDKFERKQLDRFRVESADLGNIFKLKIRHDNSGISPDWFLNRVEVIDDIRTYVFHCENWLAKGKGDNKIERTLYEKDYQGSKSSFGSMTRSVAGSIASGASGAGDHKNEPFRQNQRKNIMSSIAEENRDPNEEGIPYTVKVKTGSAHDAGTSADVFIRLVGRKGRETRMIPLELMQRRHFEPGRVETFSLQEPDIGDLEVVKIEHNGETPEDGWFLEDISIEMPTKGRVFYFPCKQWLSKHKGDGHTQRILRVQDSNQGSFRPLIPYEVSIYTGDIENAGCDCDVSLKLFGTTGSSSEHQIKKQEGYFERGTIDAFQCELDDVGKPVKLRVTILPKGKRDRNSWYLEKIEMVKHTKHNERQETYFFGLNDWINREHNFSRDIPISKGSRALIQETTYRITTKTSDISGAGSDSNVFIVLSGQFGDSQEFELKHSSTHTNKFERNNDDVFTFENILSLGELTKVRIRIDESSLFKSAWHLEHVEVEDLQTNKTYMFPCGKWLSSSKDDKQIVRDLVCKNDPSERRRDSLTPSGKIPYEIEIVTSDKENAGTMQHGWIILEGKKKRSERFYMKNTPHRKILRRGQTDTFTFECRPLGDIRRIILGHEHREEYPIKSRQGRESQWHVAHVSVTDPTSGVKFEFPVRRWLELDNEGEPIECREKTEDTIAQQRHRETINYKITVYTGNVSRAGTDANVSIILYGTLGDTGPRPLKQKGRNLFERGQVDEFTIEALDLGELKKLHIEHDNSMISPDWFLDKVEVTNTATGEMINFPCNRWLGKNHDDGEIQRDLLPIHVS